MDRSNYAFSKMNFILLAVGMVFVVLGFILMSGSGSAEGTFDADIFSARRIKVAPLCCLFGFLFIIYAIMFKKLSEMSITTNDKVKLLRKTNK